MVWTCRGAMSLSGRLMCWSFALAAALSVAALIGADGARAACNTSDTDQTCTNSTALSAVDFGIEDTATLTLTNTVTGSVFGYSHVGYGIRAANADVSNRGSISGTGDAFGRGYGIFAATTATVNNWASIFGSAGDNGQGYGVYTNNTAIVSNGGSISGTAGNSGNGFGINAPNVRVTNWGSISGAGGGDSYGIFAGNTATVINSGTISGTSTSGGTGILAFGSANVTNSGTISGSTSSL